MYPYRRHGWHVTRRLILVTRWWLWKISSHRSLLNMWFNWALDQCHSALKSLISHVVTSAECDPRRFDRLADPYRRLSSPCLIRKLVPEVGTCLNVAELRPWNSAAIECKIIHERKKGREKERESQGKCKLASPPCTNQGNLSRPHSSPFHSKHLQSPPPGFYDDHFISCFS